jgi:3-oxoacyl-[acyl-carrier protein] reductase
MNQRLDGKVAVVCGASSGIGRETALVLARAGATVVAAARGETGCTAVAELVKAEGGRAHTLTADLEDWGQVQSLAEQTEAVCGAPADILVVTAGTVLPVGKSWEVAPAEWARNVQVNLLGSFHVARAFLPGMVARRSGVIALVSSVAVKLATPCWGAYGASKAGIDFLGRVMQAELDLDDIPVRVHVAYPGVVDTPMQETIRSFSEEEFPSVAAFRRMHEKGRLRPPVHPANLILWLTTSAAADLKGQIADLDDPGIRERVATDLGVEPF